MKYKERALLRQTKPSDTQKDRLAQRTIKIMDFCFIVILFSNVKDSETER